MQVWTDLGQVPAGWGPSVVTLGNFDGVHRGHTTVLGRMVADAAARGLRAVAITFTPHPLRVHRPEACPVPLTGDADRLDLLAAVGLDAVLLVSYTLDFARQSPEEFVRSYLVDTLHAATVVVGADVRFGWQNSGDLATMQRLGAELGFDVDVITDVTGTVAAGDAPGAGVAPTADGAPAVDGAHAAVAAGPRRWSSTWARELLDAGDVAGAAAVLGRHHFMRGVVVHGDARGRTIGFPTANLSSDADGMIPADGVYAGWLERLDVAAGAPDRLLPAAVSVGTNPTFDGVQRRVEAYVLDRDDLDLYGETVRIAFVDLLRPTLRFDSVDALVERMHEDVSRARAILAATPPGSVPGPA